MKDYDKIETLKQESLLNFYFWEKSHLKWTETNSSELSEK